MPLLLFAAVTTPSPSIAPWMIGKLYMHVGNVTGMSCRTIGRIAYILIGPAICENIIRSVKKRLESIVNSNMVCGHVDKLTYMTLRVQAGHIWDIMVRFKSFLKFIFGFKHRSQLKTSAISEILFNSSVYIRYTWIQHFNFKNLAVFKVLLIEVRYCVLVLNLFKFDNRRLKARFRYAPEIT